MKKNWAKRPLAVLLFLALSSCNTSAPRQAVFNFRDQFGSLSGVDQICHFETFDGRKAKIQISELERECGCDLAQEASVNYRSTLFVIRGRELLHAEATHHDLGYIGDLEAWRRERSFCFPARRLSLDLAGNLIIGAD